MMRNCWTCQFLTSFISCKQPNKSLDDQRVAWRAHAGPVSRTDTKMLNNAMTTTVTWLMPPLHTSDCPVWERRDA